MTIQIQGYDFKTPAFLPEKGRGWPLVKGQGKVKDIGTKNDTGWGEM